MNWAVFVSGRGSNLAALLETGRVRTVVSSKRDCPAVNRARRRGIEVIFLEKDYQSLTQQLIARGIQKIMLAGFMKILPDQFVSTWQGRIFNVHPSLLPNYPGLRSIKRAFEDDAEIGVSVHHVDKGVDTGKLIWQKTIEKPNSLFLTEQAVHIQEHQLVRRLVK